LELTANQRLEIQRALEILSPLNIPLDVAANRYAQAHTSLAETKADMVEAARARGGGDVFWTTENEDIASLFAQANPKGGPPSVVSFQIPSSTFNSMLNSGAVTVDRTGAYMIHDWEGFNQAVIGRSAK
jgi:hypothetical protein